jgi:hypothetical protein
MKNKIFTAITIFVFSFAALAVEASEIDRTFSDYEISKVTTKALSSGADDAWVLSYDKNESPIVITLHKTKRCNYYVVRAEHFEVAYLCNKKGFGASWVKSSYSNYPEELTRKVINDSELERQRILTSNQPTNEEALELIASYLPDLVNPSYKHLLN